MEQVLENSSGTRLALDLRKSGLALNDLNVMIKVSNLVSKDALSEHLERFVGEAQKVGRILHRLGSRVGVAVDG